MARLSSKACVYNAVSTIIMLTTSDTQIKNIAKYVKNTFINYGYAP